MKEQISSRMWDNENKCIYCSTKLDDPKSEHVLEFHYKKTTCKKCGKKIWFRVDFDGSGHDNLSYSELEERIF